MQTTKRTKAETEQQDLYREVDKEIAAERGKAVDAFNELWADWLEAQARMIRPSRSDDAEEDDLIKRADDAADEVMWKIIHMPAPTRYQLDRKFEILLGMAADPFADGRGTAMINSIRTDAITGVD